MIASKQDLSRCPLRGDPGTGHPNILRVKTAAWRRRTRAATVDVLMRLRSTCQSRCRLLKAECLLPLAADKNGLWRLEPRLRRTAGSANDRDPGEGDRKDVPALARLPQTPECG